MLPLEKKTPNVTRSRLSTWSAQRTSTRLERGCFSSANADKENVKQTQEPANDTWSTPPTEKPPHQLVFGPRAYRSLAICSAAVNEPSLRRLKKHLGVRTQTSPARREKQQQREGASCLILRPARSRAGWRTPRRLQAGRTKPSKRSYVPIKKLKLPVPGCACFHSTNRSRAKKMAKGAQAAVAETAFAFPTAVIGKKSRSRPQSTATRSEGALRRSNSVFDV